MEIATRKRRKRHFPKKRGRKTRLKRLRTNLKAFGHVFTPMCIFCQNMHDEWEDLKNTMKKPVYKHIANEDIGDNHEEKIQALNEKYKISLESLGYPTIFRIVGSNNKNEVEIYSGERTKRDILKWLVAR